MDSILARYEKVLRIEGKSQSTIRSYYNNLRSFLIYTQKPNIESWQIEDYLDCLLRKNIEHSTYNQIMYSIRNYCRIFGYGFPNTVSKLRVRRKEEFIPQKFEIIRSIYLTEDFRDKVVMALLFDGWHRREEAQKQLIRNIDFTHDRIIIDNAKDRIVDISPKTKYLIKAYLQIRPEKNNPYLFAADNAQKYVSKSYLFNVVNQAGKLVGYDDWHPHLMRKAGATISYLETGDLLYVSNKLGHQDIKVTQTYLGLKREHLVLHKPVNYVPLLS